MGSLLPFQCCCCFRFNKRFARKSIHYKSLQISLLSTIYPLLILLNSNETTTLLILLTTFKKCKKKKVIGMCVHEIHPEEQCIVTFLINLM